MATPSLEPPGAVEAPRSCADLFWSFTVLALQGWGGVVAVVQRDLVERKRWMTREQFLEDWSVAQIMPGPNVVNLALMFGGRHFGWRGALAALAGMLAAPLVVVLSLTFVYGQMAIHPAVQGALRGMGLVSAGLIAATALKLMGTLGDHGPGRRASLLLGVATFVAIAGWRWPLPAVLLGLGGLGWAWTHWRLGRPPS